MTDGWALRVTTPGGSDDNRNLTQVFGAPATLFELDNTANVYQQQANYYWIDITRLRATEDGETSFGFLTYFFDDSTRVAIAAFYIEWDETNTEFDCTLNVYDDINDTYGSSSVNFSVDKDVAVLFVRNMCRGDGYTGATSISTTVSPVPSFDLSGAYSYVNVTGHRVIDLYYMKVYAYALTTGGEVIIGQPIVDEMYEDANDQNVYYDDPYPIDPESVKIKDRATRDTAQDSTKDWTYPFIIGELPPRSLYDHQNSNDIYNIDGNVLTTGIDVSDILDIVNDIDDSMGASGDTADPIGTSIWARIKALFTFNGWKHIIEKQLEALAAGSIRGSISQWSTVFRIVYDTVLSLIGPSLNSTIRLMLGMTPKVGSPNFATTYGWTPCTGSDLTTHPLYSIAERYSAYDVYYESRLNWISRQLIEWRFPPMGWMIKGPSFPWLISRLYKDDRNQVLAFPPQHHRASYTPLVKVDIGDVVSKIVFAGAITAEASRSLGGLTPGYDPRGLESYIENQLDMVYNDSELVILDGLDFTVFTNENWCVHDGGVYKFHHLLMDIATPVVAFLGLKYGVSRVIKAVSGIRKALINKRKHAAVIRGQEDLQVIQEEVINRNRVALKNLQDQIDSIKRTIAFKRL